MYKKIFLLICGMLYANIAYAETPEEPGIYINALEGNSKIKNNTNDTLLFKGKIIKQGTTIETKKNGKITLKINNFSSVRIAPNSIVHINKNTKNELSIQLKKGDIWSNVNNLEKNKKFEIFTDVAQMAIKGTIFRVIANNNYTTDLRVYRGKVEWKNKKDKSTQIIEKGMEIGLDKKLQQFKIRNIDKNDKLEKINFAKFNKEKDKRLIKINNILLNNLDEKTKNKLNKNKTLIEQNSKMLKLEFNRKYKQNMNDFREIAQTKKVIIKKLNSDNSDKKFVSILKKIEVKQQKNINDIEKNIIRELRKINLTKLNKKIIEERNKINKNRIDVNYIYAKALLHKLNETINSSELNNVDKSAIIYKIQNDIDHTLNNSNMDPNKIEELQNSLQLIEEKNNIQPQPLPLQPLEEQNDIQTQSSSMQSIE